MQDKKQWLIDSVRVRLEEIEAADAFCCVLGEYSDRVWASELGNAKVTLAPASSEQEESRSTNLRNLDLWLPDFKTRSMQEIEVRYAIGLRTNNPNGGALGLYLPPSLPSHLSAPTTEEVYFGKASLAFQPWSCFAYFYLRSRSRVGPVPGLPGAKKQEEAQRQLVNLKSEVKQLHQLQRKLIHGGARVEVVLFWTVFLLTTVTRVRYTSTESHRDLSRV